MQQILLVEDGQDFVLIVEETLSSSFALTVARNYEEAVQKLEAIDFDLILLDISLPGKSGMELFASLADLKKNTHTPVIFLTGKSDTPSKIAAFSMGAEDYIVKPFDPMELKARVQSKLKKAIAIKESGETINKGDLQIVVSLQRVRVVSENPILEIDLTSTEFKILSHLARQEGRVFSRDELRSIIWGNTVVSDRTIDVHVSALRRKLKLKSTYIESVRGTGYMFRTSIRRAA